MIHTIPVPELVAVPIQTAGGVRHVTGQTIDQAGLLAIHPELDDAGFTGRWQITHILTGVSVDVQTEASAHLDRRALTPAHIGGEF